MRVVVFLEEVWEACEQKKEKKEKKKERMGKGEDEGVDEYHP